MRSHAATATADAAVVDAIHAVLTGPADRAARWLAAAARRGHTEAQAIFGQWLLDGRGVDRNAAEALFWFKTAALSGHAMAANMLGRCYEHGWGAPACDKTATHWYARAADAGLDWGQYNYATSLQLGRGIPADRARAFALFQAAARQGHAKSINVLGGFYEDGWEVETDIAIALHCYLRAAEGGDFRGQFNAARLFALADRTDEARTWMRAVPHTATPAFLAKAHDFLAGHPDVRLRALAGALETASPCC
ncbi:tetratricopeptide repeat protein [Ralstonia soli]|uniref:Sel1 repeat family protein n=1 Tax=Ralstonia soli TaxID=2953896 RepID=A0ABT1AFC2_9RALS|nr:tetratricopeptide repeat protein [Ralstonia soli]MCO5397009.1 sel1 repeat family protein [Ralstonia soli]